MSCPKCGHDTLRGGCGCQPSTGSAQIESEMAQSGNAPVTESVATRALGVEGMDNFDAQVRRVIAQLEALHLRRASQRQAPALSESSTIVRTESAVDNVSKSSEAADFKRPIKADQDDTKGLRSSHVNCTAESPLGDPSTLHKVISWLKKPFQRRKPDVKRTGSGKLGDRDNAAAADVQTSSPLGGEVQQQPAISDGRESSSSATRKLADNGKEGTTSPLDNECEEKEVDIIPTLDQMPAQDKKVETKLPFAKEQGQCNKTKNVPQLAENKNSAIDGQEKATELVVPAADQAAPKLSKKSKSEDLTLVGRTETDNKDQLTSVQEIMAEGSSKPLVVPWASLASAKDVCTAEKETPELIHDEVDSKDWAASMRQKIESTLDQGQLEGMRMVLAVTGDDKLLKLLDSRLGFLKRAAVQPTPAELGKLLGHKPPRPEDFAVPIEQIHKIPGTGDKKPDAPVSWMDEAFCFPCNRNAEIRLGDVRPLTIPGVICDACAGPHPVAWHDAVKYCIEVVRPARPPAGAIFESCVHCTARCDPDKAKAHPTPMCGMGAYYIHDEDIGKVPRSDYENIYSGPSSEGIPWPKRAYSGRVLNKKFKLLIGNESSAWGLQTNPAPYSGRSLEEALSFKQSDLPYPLRVGGMRSGLWQPGERPLMLQLQDMAPMTVRFLERQGRDVLGFPIRVYKRLGDELPRMRRGLGMGKPVPHRDSHGF